MRGGAGGDRSAIRHLIAAAAVALAPAGAAPAEAAGDVLNGLTLTKLLCTRCHVVSTGVEGGSRGPVLPNIVNRMRLTPEKLRAWLNAEHPPMPNFNRELTQQQIDDIVAYLDTLRVR